MTEDWPSLQCAGTGPFCEGTTQAVESPLHSHRKKKSRAIKQIPPSTAEQKQSIEAVKVICQL